MTAYLIHHLTPFLLTWPLSCHLRSTSSFLGPLYLFLLSLAHLLWSWTLFFIFHLLILHSWSLIPHSFPHTPLGPPPNHLTSHLMDHLTILQSTITCHHSAVCSIPQHHHLTHYGLPAYDTLSIDCQLMMELYLDCQLIASSLPAHDVTLLYVTLLFCDLYCLWHPTCI